jgi:hypothetical protein
VTCLGRTSEFPSQFIILADIVSTRMKISGFTIVRNAVRFDYPVIESINSILPIVDDFLVAVGKSDDGTLDLIRSIDSPKIKIVESVWDDTLREGGRVLAVETDKAFQQVDPASDWVFYIQADEVVHEKDLPNILKAARDNLPNKKVQGLIFKYFHFYGTYDYIGDSRRWYPYEIRIIRNNKKIYSYRDAQGFRIGRDIKLKVKYAHAAIYHYGWVRHPQKQSQKLEHFSGFWSGAENKETETGGEVVFDFMKNVDSVERFKGIHPAVMKKRIEEKNWDLQLNTHQKKFTMKDKILYRLEKWTGIRLFRFRNYSKL